MSSDYWKTCDGAIKRYYAEPAIDTKAQIASGTEWTDATFPTEFAATNSNFSSNSKIAGLDISWKRLRNTK